MEQKADEAFMAIAKSLWRYYEESLGDTPARVTRVVYKALDEAGYTITKKLGEQQ